MIYCAPYILPVDTDPLLDGAVVVEEGRITAVGSRQAICADYPSCEVVQLPQHLLMPGLVNCHTHLELSALEGKVSAGISFTDWLREVIRVRSLWAERAGNRWQDEIKISVQKGLKRVIATGTTCVGDISASGLSKGLLEAVGLRGIVFLEAIGFKSEQAQCVVADLETKLIELLSADGLVQIGIAPHAPYSVSPRLLQQMFSLASACPDNNYKLSVHLAESQEEELFIAEGSGPLRQLLKWRGAWDETWQAPGCSPVQYLQSLEALTPNLLAVHMNYLQPEDYPLLARQQVQVVTCPCSNAWLGHENSHIQALYEREINIALGTDSLASNDDLNIFKEMQFLAKANPWLGYSEIIQMATMGGAKALGFEAQIGSLSPGKQADIVAVTAPPGMDKDKLAQYIVQQVEEAEMVMVAGKAVLEFNG